MCNFNPRSHRRERRFYKLRRCKNLHFNPRSHRRERRGRDCVLGGEIIFQPTLPPKGATPFSRSFQIDLSISTHAPTEGSDLFRSRLPHKTRNFNPRSHRRERRLPAQRQKGSHHISTHAPTEGSDRITIYSDLASSRFQPTLPPKGATHPVRPQPSRFFISTHAPTEGSDYGPTNRKFRYSYFNPRSHRRERHDKLSGAIDLSGFQPTLPPKGATTAVKQGYDHNEISTHAPTEGSDLPVIPRGFSGYISTHAPTEGSDLAFRLACASISISTHAPTEGSDGMI